METSKRTIKGLSHSALFLAFASVLVMFQLPVYGFLNLDFSLIVIIIARRYIGLPLTIIVAMIYPWAVYGAAFLPWVVPEPIGVGALMFMAVSTAIIDALLVRTKTIKTDIVPSIVSALTIATFMTFINVVLITPAYYGFDYSILIGSNVWEYIGATTVMILPFNLLKMIVIYTLTLPLKHKVKNLL